MHYHVLQSLLDTNDTPLHRVICHVAHVTLHCIHRVGARAHCTAAVAQGACVPALAWSCPRASSGGVADWDGSGGMMVCVGSGVIRVAWTAKYSLPAKLLFRCE